MSAVSIDKIKRQQKTGADQTDNTWKTITRKLVAEKGVHDLYIVYTDPKNTASSMWITLYFD